MENSYDHLANVYDALMYDVNYDAWADYIAGLLSKYKGPGCRVLEAACGTGAVTIRLKKRGFAIVGTDRSQQMLECAAQNARSAGVPVNFICQDMKMLEAAPKDAVIACCDGVNYLTSETEAKAFFSSAFRILKKSGLLLFDISSAHKLTEEIGNHFFYEDGDDITYLWQNAYCEQTRCVKMELTLFVRQGEYYFREDETHVQRAHAQEEILKWLADCGFQDGKAFGFLSEKPPAQGVDRIQFMAVKP